MSKPIIAVDFDDIVASFNYSFANWHNRTYGTSVKYEDITDYIMYNIYRLDRRTLLHRIHIFCHHHHQEIVPLPYVYEEFSILREYFELHIVTSRCESLSQITSEWLNTHLGDIFVIAHFTNGFGTKYPNNRRLKSTVCQDIGAIALIDDALMHAEEVTVNCSIPVLMPSRPWNQEKTPPGVIRMNDLCEITDWLTNKFCTQKV